jgi:hypothetical protein
MKVKQLIMTEGNNIGVAGEQLERKQNNAAPKANREMGKKNLI